ncbi:hypothetical protein BH11BAC7_BH11BAC7_35470 [soil metagenome]
MKIFSIRFAILITVNILFLIVLLFLFQQGDRNAGFITGEKVFVNKASGSGNHKDDENEFPVFENFIERRAFESGESLEAYCTTLNTNHISADSSVRVVFAFMTDSLLAYYAETLQYDPDKFHMLLLWAEPFQYYANKDTSQYAVIYTAVYDYWLNKLSNAISHACAIQPALKYDKRFCYLCQRLGDAKYYSGLKYSGSEKVLENLISGKWAYLYDRFWLETSLAFRLLLLACILITITSCVYSAYSIVIKIKNKRIGKQQ